MQPLAEHQRHDIWLTGWQNQRDIEWVPSIAAIYPRKYCRQSSKSHYWEASQATVFFCLYDSYAVYFTLGNKGERCGNKKENHNLGAQTPCRVTDISG